MLTSIALPSFYSVAAEPYSMTISVTNNTTGTKQTVDITPISQAVMALDDEATLIGEAYIKIPSNELDPIEIMDASTYASSTTDTSSTQNTYWKATVSVTYTDDGTYCTFSKAGASWTQLRGTTTLSNREVYWGYTLGLKAGGKTEYPTSNSVSYNTGLGALKYGGGSLIGCNSSAMITLQSGSTLKLEANIEKDF